MKWFKHFTDATSNLKMQLLINKFGLEGYGYYWSLLELVGNQGKNFRIKAAQGWKVYLKKSLEIDIAKQELILNFLAENHFIDKPSFADGDLYIPKLEDRSDDYTNKVRRKSGHGSDKVPLEEEVEEEVDKKKKESIVGTSTLTKQFFKDIQIQEDFVKFICEKYPEADNQLIKKELKKFIDYWTAPIQSGKKQLWETKPTFVVSLRFQNWLNNVKNFSKQDRKIIT